eukprot:tig00021579_g22431.t1
MLRGEHSTEIFAAMRDKFGRLHQGPFFGFWLVYVYEPEGLRQALQASSDVFEKAAGDVMQPLAQEFIGKNVVFENGPAWSRHRRLMAPAFHFDALRPLVPTFGAYGARLCGALEAAGGSPVDAADLLQRFAIDVLGPPPPPPPPAAASPADASGCSQGRRPSGGTSGRWRGAGTPSSRTTTSPSTPPARPRAPRPAPAPERGGRRRSELVALRDAVDRPAAPPSNRRARRAFAALDRMLRRTGGGLGLTDKELRDNLVVFLIAGHDTTAVALFYALHSLARHPEIQERARAEVDGILGAGPERLRAPTLEDLNRLEYLNLVIKEGMRMYPPVYTIPLRRLSADTNLLGHHLPKGTLVTIPLHSIHHDPEFWPEPEKFDPERFTPERSEGLLRRAAQRGAAPVQLCAVPGGARTCLGNNFSLLEQRALLCMVLARFRVRPPDGAPPLRFANGSAIILKPHPACTRLVFEPRGP